MRILRNWFGLRCALRVCPLRTILVVDQSVKMGDVFEKREGGVIRFDPGIKDTYMECNICGKRQR